MYSKVILYSILSSASFNPGDKHNVGIASIDFDPKEHFGTPIGEISHKIIYLSPPHVTENIPEPFIT